MTNPRTIVQHDVELLGCTPEPLMSYLKALGILRLVSEQVDPNARGWWKNDVFWIRSTLDHDALVKFFLEVYSPTPIVAPWAGGSGFFGKDNRKFVDAIHLSSHIRLGEYRDIIDRVRAIIASEGISAKPADEDKVRLIARYRCELSNHFVAWMDAAMVVRIDGQGFAPLLGTGGNDGRLDFTQNFMGRIVEVGLHESGTTSAQSTSWIRNALLSEVATLRGASVGQFAPGRAGGPNATQGFDGDASDNPWDFILMLEGSLILAGVASKRLGFTATTSAAFPFTVRPVAAGFSSPTVKDEKDSRGELWLPLWDRAMNIGELRQLFGEGRADIAGRVARDGADFARAVANLGIDRGVTAFTRIGFLKRSGLSFLAAPLGRFNVVERRDVDLIREVDGWLSNFRRACAAKTAPARLDSVLRRIDSAIFDFCRHGGAAQFQRILIGVGGAEQALGIVERFRDDKKIKPIADLSQHWITAADDGSPEFRLALALASIQSAGDKVGPLRANLEAVDWSKKQCKAWAEKDRSVVWSGADLSSNLANVIQRRMMDATRAGCDALPIASNHSVSLEVVSAFLAGELDEIRIEQLLWGLLLVKPRGMSPLNTMHVESAPLPRNYALLKLLFIPTIPVIAAEGNAPIVIRPEPRILPLLCAGRIDEACKIAANRLRVSGLSPIPSALPTGIMREPVWESADASNAKRGQRLAAALLIPISRSSITQLIQLVTHVPATQGNTQ